MTREILPIHKHFLVIDSPIPFTLVANNGTDEVYRMAGAWRIDMWKLLTKEYFKQYPVFNLELVYDETLLKQGQSVITRQSDIDLGSGIAGVNGQAVKVTNFDEISKILKKNYNIFHHMEDFLDFLHQQYSISEEEDVIFTKNMMENLNISLVSSLVSNDYELYFDGHNYYEVNRQSGNNVVYKIVNIQQYSHDTLLFIGFDKDYNVFRQSIYDDEEYTLRIAYVI